VLSKLLEALYNRVYVSIVVDKLMTMVYIEVCNSSGPIEAVERSFANANSDTKMNEFIYSYIQETPYYYVSLLDTSISQGAIPTCKSSEMNVFCDTEDIQHKCYMDKWAYYTSKLDLSILEKRYSDIGVDFIFSPFVVLSQFFKDKIESNMAMYILIEDRALSLTVFDHSELLYAEYLDMQNVLGDDEDLIIDDMADDDIDIDLGIDEGIDLDDIDALDELEELDDFGDIEDLDSIEDIDEFSDDKDEEDEFEETELEEKEADEYEGFNEDYQRFALIKSSVHSYYKDPKYKSEFIETVYIADGVGVSSDLKRYLEEEMFLSVYVRHTDLDKEICDLAKAELK